MIPFLLQVSLSSAHTSAKRSITQTVSILTLSTRRLIAGLKNLVSYIYSSGIDRNHYVPFGNKFKKIIGKCCKDEIFASIDNANRTKIWAKEDMDADHVTAW